MTFDQNGQIDLEKKSRLNANSYQVTQWRIQIDVYFLKIVKRAGSLNRDVRVHLTSSNFMYLMSPLFCEKGGTLFKGGHYLRKYGMWFRGLNIAQIYYV